MARGKQTCWKQQVDWESFSRGSGHGARKPRQQSRRALNSPMGLGPKLRCTQLYRKRANAVVLFDGVGVKEIWGRGPAIGQPRRRATPPRQHFFSVVTAARVGLVNGHERLRIALFRIGAFSRLGRLDAASCYLEYRLICPSPNHDEAARASGRVYPQH